MGFDDAHVEIERRSLVDDIERDLAKAPVIVLPAPMQIEERVIGELFKVGSERTQGRDRCARPRRQGLGCLERADDGAIGREEVDVPNLAFVAGAIELDDGDGDVMRGQDCDQAIPIGVELGDVGILNRVRE